MLAFPFRDAPRFSQESRQGVVAEGDVHPVIGDEGMIGRQPLPEVEGLSILRFCFLDSVQLVQEEREIVTTCSQVKPVIEGRGVLRDQFLAERELASMFPL